MTCKDLDEYFKKNKPEDWNDDNIFAPPLDAQEAVIMLCHHFLGPNWYSVNPIHQTQINTEIMYEILQKYPHPRGYIKHKLEERKFVKRFSFKGKIINKLKKFFDKYIIED